MKQKKVIVIDGVRYYADRPGNCSGCYFWKNKKEGCLLGRDNCYYLAGAIKKKSPCEGCPYGRVKPCIGFCMKKILGEKGVPTGA